MYYNFIFYLNIKYKKNCMFLDVLLKLKQCLLIIFLSSYEFIDKNIVTLMIAVFSDLTLLKFNNCTMHISCGTKSYVHNTNS